MTGAEQRSDAELLAATKRDPQAFGEFYDRNVEAILGWFYRRVGCAQTSLDLTAETFAAALVAAGKFRDHGVPARAWLYGIATRQLGTFARRQRVATKYRRRLGVSDVEVAPDELERIEELADFAALRVSVRESLAQLSPALAQAVMLRVGHDLSYPEVAAALECSEPAARARVSRGLTQLADLMEKP